MIRQQKAQQETNSKPFPLGPEIREDQSLPPAPEGPGGNAPSDSQGRDRNGEGEKSGEGVQEGDIRSAIKVCYRNS